MQLAWTVVVRKINNTKSALHNGMYMDSPRQSEFATDITEHVNLLLINTHLI